jgi:hypothetical protein
MRSVILRVLPKPNFETVDVESPRRTAMETIASLVQDTGLPIPHRLWFRLAVVGGTGQSVPSLPSFGSGDPFRTAGKK